MTINRDMKLSGGKTGFSTKTNEINRWALNASFRAKLCSSFYKHLGYINGTLAEHNDLSTSRIARDEKDVKSFVEVITNMREHYVDPLSDNDLLCISNGLKATKSVRNDLQQAKQCGEKALTAFIVQRLGSESEVFI